MPNRDPDRPLFIIGDNLSQVIAKSTINAAGGALSVYHSLGALWHLSARGILAAFRDMLHEILVQLVASLHIKRVDRYLNSKSMHSIFFVLKYIRSSYKGRKFVVRDVHTMISTFIFELLRLELQRARAAFATLSGAALCEKFVKDLNDASVEKKLREGGFETAIWLRFVVRLWISSYVELNAGIENAQPERIIRALKHALMVLVPTGHMK